MFFSKSDQQDAIAGSVDQFTDSYARDVTTPELKEVREYHRPRLLNAN
jgi:hypothetical protein